MKTTSLFLAILFLSIPFAGHGTTARQAWDSLLTEKSRKMEAFAFVENNPALPNVLIYGDSISIGYTPQVRKQLHGLANVYRLHTNGGDSASFIEKMEAMHKTMQSNDVVDRWDFDWDVIQFNVGLHDLKYVVDGKLDKEHGKQVHSTQQYRDNLSEIIKYLQQLAPRAKLIFATTTPVPEGEQGRVHGDAARYNKVALKVMKKYPEIIINDLFTFTLPNQPQWWTKPGNVHFNSVGVTAQGNEVAQVITAALKEDSR